MWQNMITKCVRLVDYKVWQNGLQSESEITKRGRVDYKVRQGLQYVAGLQSECACIYLCLSKLIILAFVLLFKKKQNGLLD